MLMTWKISSIFSTVTARILIKALVIILVPEFFFAISVNFSAHVMGILGTNELRYHMQAHEITLISQMNELSVCSIDFHVPHIFSCACGEFTSL